MDIPALYKHLLSTSQYQILTGSIDHDEISITYSVPDLADFTERKFQRSFFINDSKLVGSSRPVQVDKRVRGSVLGKTCEWRVIEGEKEKVFCEIWKSGIETDRFELKDIKDVYLNHRVIGPPAEGGTDTMFFIAEPVEKKFDKGAIYFNGETTGPDIPVSDKFKYVPDFGETMTKVRRPQLCMLAGRALTVLPGLDHLCPLYVKCFGPARNQLLVSGFVMEGTDLSSLYLPGLSYCFNRKTGIYLYDLSEMKCMRCLTQNIFLALSPLIDGVERGEPRESLTIVFAGHREKFHTHCTELELFKLDLKDESASEPVEIIAQKVRNDYAPAAPTYNGLYLVNQADSGSVMSFLPHSSRSVVVLPSFSSGRGGIFVIDVSDSPAVSVLSIYPPGYEEKFCSVSLLKVDGLKVLFVAQGYTCQRSLWLGTLSVDANCWSAKYVQLFTTVEVDPTICKGFLGASISVVQTDNCPAWLLRSSLRQETTGGNPLICYFHGGPFMGAVSSFSVEIAAFLSQGYDVVIPNYRGSFSFGREFLKSLEGQCGIVDVADCIDSVLLAKSLLKPSLLVAYGGSHGGFLTAWLLGHPKWNTLFSGGVLWNPAVDIVSSCLTSDIPEWALSVAAHDELSKTEESRFAPSIQFITKAYNQSPISVIKNVRAPSLVLLGSNDKRVVPCAGLRWAQAVQSNGSKVDVHWYPDQGHAIAGPEFYETAITTISLWIANIVKQRLKQ